MKKIKMDRNQGFTLLEVMISLGIFAFISVGVYELTSSTFRRREELEAEGDFYNSVRQSLVQVERDIIMMYTPQAASLPGTISQNETDTAAQNGQLHDMPFDPGQPTDFWSIRINRFGVRPSRFVGSSNKMNFVNSGHIRLYRDSHESSFAKITYVLEEEPLEGQVNSFQKMLVRYEDIDIYNDESKFGDSPIRYILLRGIKTLKFEYLDGKSDQWLHEWDTERPEQKNRFPNVISVSVEVIQPPPFPANTTWSLKLLMKPELVL